MMQYSCCDENRRNAIKNHGTLNGIKFMEVSEDQLTIYIHFIKPLAKNALVKENIDIQGGERIKKIKATKVYRSGTGDKADILTVKLNKFGDFSTYTLCLIPDSINPHRLDGFDPILRTVDFSFKVNCFNDFDCQKKRVCQLQQHPRPEINYLAKDYGSFRQLMLDRISALFPDWKERNIADAAITLIELLAYVGDYLSYQQDAIATEAYLGTARSRISIRRHARLVDYFMHNGCNARVWVQVKVNADVTLHKHTKFLTFIEDQPGLILTFEQPMEQEAEVFETMYEAKLFHAHNEFHFYTWGDRECCLPRNATGAILKGHFPNLKAGDVLIFVEVLGPNTGKQEDADSLHRHAVRLINVIIKTDPLNNEPITEIEWHAKDALPYPFCISSIKQEETSKTYIEDVSLAFGNIVLADHGLTIEEPEYLGEVPQTRLFRVQPGNDRCIEGKNNPVPPRFNPHLKEKNLTFTVPYKDYSLSQDNFGMIVKKYYSANETMNYNAKDALPEIILKSKKQDSTLEQWTPKPDLLESKPEDCDYVVEMETDGTAYLRFGNDRHGLRPDQGMNFFATYRRGNGKRGNIGVETIAHIINIIPEVREGVISVCNLLPAQGGIEPESIEDVRQKAPYAFRKQERAVNQDDYAEVAERYPNVQQAAATFRWTGSWYTVFTTIDRMGGSAVDEDFKTKMREHLEKYRMAGHDIEIDAPHFISLEIEMKVCVKPDYFPSDIKDALLEVFNNRDLPDGRRGVFHPDNFTFGQTVYLSPLYKAAQEIDGIAWVQITRFQRLGIDSNEALDAGKLILGRLEIARLDNDQNYPENGILRLIMEGGK